MVAAAINYAPHYLQNATGTDVGANGCMKFLEIAYSDGSFRRSSTYSRKCIMCIECLGMGSKFWRVVISNLRAFEDQPISEDDSRCQDIGIGGCS